MKNFLLVVFLFCTYRFSNAQQMNIAPGNLLIMVNSENDAQQLTKDFQYLNGIKTDFKIERLLSKSMHIYLYDFNSAVSNSQLLNAIKINPLVKMAQLNHHIEERTVPNDSLFGSMWDM